MKVDNPNYDLVILNSESIKFLKHKSLWDNSDLDNYLVSTSEDGITNRCSKFDEFAVY